MKKDLFTYGVLAVIGVIAAYFVCNLFLPPLEDTKIKVLTSTESYTLSDPNPEIFNFRAINPTVPGYINCEEYDSDSTCIRYADDSNDEGGFMDDYFNSGDNNGDSD